MSQEWVTVGKIVGVFGLDGHVKISPMTDFPERFSPRAVLYIQKQPYRIQKSHWHKNQVRVRFISTQRIEDAEALIGKFVQVPIADVPELEENEFLVKDLLGLAVVDQDGNALGKVDDIVSGPAQDLIRIGQSLIPIVKEFVKEIDIQGGRIVVQPIPGMLEDSE